MPELDDAQKDRLVHLMGYAAIAGVLASWSGPVGAVIGYGFAAAIGIVLLVLATEKAVAGTQAWLDEPAGVDTEDGGEPADG
jgi:high-affinity nickel permease